MVRQITIREYEGYGERLRLTIHSTGTSTPDWIEVRKEWLHSMSHETRKAMNVLDIPLREAKRLHAWLGKAINQMEGK